MTRVTDYDAIAAATNVERDAVRRVLLAAGYTPNAPITASYIRNEAIETCALMIEERCEELECLLNSDHTGRTNSEVEGWRQRKLILEDMIDKLRAMMTTPDDTKVFVIMTNDYPYGVASTADGAEAAIAQAKAEHLERLRQSEGSLERAETNDRVLCSLL